MTVKSELQLGSNGLVLSGVRHAYESQSVIGGVDLVVARGEVVCLVGPSGCGKTTLLRIAAGLERPTVGDVSICGLKVASSDRFVSPEKRQVGLMFQDYALFPHMRVADNIIFGLRATKAHLRNSIVEDLMRRFQIDHLAAAYPHELSGGEQQRVALARGLAPNPKVMLLDEPFSGLDKQLRETVREDTLKFLKEEEVATLLVTHDSEEALSMADRIALMRGGTIEQSGPAQDLYLHPATPFVAKFFGTLPVFESHVRGRRVETPVGTVSCDYGDGCAVRVYVRSEGLEILSRDAKERQSDLPMGHILDRRIIGSVTQLKLLVDGCLSPISVSLAERTPLTRDDTVCIRLDPRRTFVFPASQDV